MDNKSNIIDNEVNRLLEKNNINKDEFIKLRNKIGDNDLVDKIQSTYIKKYESIKKRAQAFARKILEKQGINNQPFSQLVIKAHKYAQKYELSDIEMNLFKKILEMELAGVKPDDVPDATSRISKVLGNITIDTKGFGMKLTDDDYKYLQDILKIRNETKALHSQVILQSLSYNDCDNSAVSGQFRPENGHKKTCHVPPVIAALFLPKFDTLEQHFLYSNIANIISARNSKQPFQTRPDYELFYNLVSDPNDVVCDSRSPLADLKNRCELQKQLWQTVLALRNGQYYQCDQLNLLNAIDKCKLNKYDKPDLVYGKYDGTIIKRLFAAFSFRPTVVLSVPTPQVMSINPYFQTSNPIISSIPMINLRLPEYSSLYRTGITPTGISTIDTDSFSTERLSLSKALEQSQLFFENGHLIMKQTQVICSRGILVFFIDRRKHKLDIGKLTNPVNVVGLPTAISGFERINTTPLADISTAQIKLSKVEATSIQTDSTSGTIFDLRSVVCAKTASNTDTTIGEDIVSDLFTGSKTYVRSCRTSKGIEELSGFTRSGSVLSGEDIEYDPMNVSTSGSRPITRTDELATIKDIKTHSIIFIFEQA